MPWNFPLLMPAWKLAPALAMGNSVVLKPNEHSPLTAVAVAALAVEAGLPAARSTCARGTGFRPARRSVAIPGSTASRSPGSVEVGKRMLIYSGESNMKPVRVETGGKGPQIVLDDAADLDEVARAVARGVFYNQGQVCSAGSRLIAQHAVHDEIVAKVVALARRCGSATRSTSARSSGPDQRRPAASNRRLLATARDEGGCVEVGGRSANVVAGGHYYEPTVITAVGRGHTVFQEGVRAGPRGHRGRRGRCRDRRGQRQPLRPDGRGVDGDVSSALTVARKLRSGTVRVNTFDRSDVALPFGGFGQSGHGRAKSAHALSKLSDSSPPGSSTDCAPDVMCRCHRSSADGEPRHWRF